MKNGARMVGNGHPAPVGILEDFVAAALSAESKARSLQCPDDLRSGHARQLLAHTATATEVRLTASGWGISSPEARRSSQWRRMAS